MSLVLLTVGICVCMTQCATLKPAEGSPTDNLKELTLKAINDRFIGFVNDQCRGEIVLENKLAWSFPSHVKDYDEWLLCRDCNFSRDTIFLDSNDLNNYDSINEWFVLRDAIDTKSWCGSYQFSPLFKTPTKGVYIIYWIFSSYVEKSTFIVLLREHEGKFKIMKELYGTVIHDP